MSDDVDLTRFEREDDGETSLGAALARARAAEERAEALQSRLRDKVLLLGKFEHILKTSFTVIAGYSKTLDESWERLSDSQRRTALAAMRRKAEETVSQAESLLADVSAEVAGLDLRLAHLDVAAALRQAVEDHQRSFPAHRFVYGGPDRLPIVTDAIVLHQILGQLLENAAKYSPPRSAITVDAGRTGDGAVRIEVRDEGAGIPDGVALFQPFVRGPAAAAETSGSGLGLYIVRNLVDLLGGEIVATRNSGERAGSTFTLVLPASEQARDHEPIPIGRRPPG